MREWPEKTLGDLVTLQRGIDLPATKRAEGQVPVMGSFGVTGYHDEAAMRGPGVTVGRSGASIGVVSYIERDYWPLNTCLYVKDFHGNNPRFAYYLLGTLDLAHYNSGSAQPSLNRNYIHPIPLAIPSREEQDQIVKLLGALDDKIELNRRTNETLEAMARAIFKDWFVDFGPTRAKAKGRAPYLAPELWNLFPDALDDEDKPVGWRDTTVEHIAEKVALGPFGSNIKVSTFVSEGVPIISGQHLNGTILEEPSFKYITPDHAECLKNSNVYRGDIVFTHAGNIGQVSYIPPNSKHQRYVLSQRQFYLRCDPKAVSHLFMVHFFRSPEGQHKLLANASSTGVPSIARPATNLKSIQFCLPARAIISKFDSIAAHLHDKILSNRRGSEALAQTRDILLPKLMSGEIRLREAENAVEAVA